MIKAIVFDMWSTLGNNPYKFHWKLYEILKLPMNRRKYIKIYERALETSEIGMEDGLRLVLKRLNVHYTEKELKKYLSMFRKANSQRKLFPDTKRYIPLFAKEYKLGLLSNSESFGVKKVKPIEKYFDVLNYSFNVEKIKPSGALFRQTLKDLKVKPSEALMVGDNPIDDYKAAKKIGMHGVVIDRFGRHKEFKHRVCSLAGLKQKLDRGEYDG